MEDEDVDVDIVNEDVEFRDRQETLADVDMWINRLGPSVVHQLIREDDAEGGGGVAEGGWESWFISR